MKFRIDFFSEKCFYIYTSEKKGRINGQYLKCPNKKTVENSEPHHLWSREILFLSRSQKTQKQLKTILAWPYAFKTDILVIENQFQIFIESVVTF